MTPSHTTVARRDNAPAGAGTALTVTGSPSGVLFDIHTADFAQGDPAFKEMAVRLSYGDAADIVRVLTEFLHGTTTGVVS